MTLRTQLKATLENYLVEFQDNTACVVEANQVDSDHPQVGSTVLVNEKYTAIVIASGKCIYNKYYNCNENIIIRQ